MKLKTIGRPKSGIPFRSLLKVANYFREVKNYEVCEKIYASSWYRLFLPPTVCKLKQIKTMQMLISCVLLPSTFYTTKELCFLLAVLSSKNVSFEREQPPTTQRTS